MNFFKGKQNKISIPDSSAFRDELSRMTSNILETATASRNKLEELKDDDKALEQMAKVINNRAIDVRRRK